MVQREFEIMCKNYGFIKQAKHRYVRCIGDGIFQSIFCGYSKYIDPESPNYNSVKRKSHYISIGIYSLFSQCRKELFDPSEYGGGGIFTTSDFCPYDNGDAIFHGIEREYDKMAAYGFAALNNINSQETFLDFYSKTKLSRTGSRIHTLSLVEPFLITGQVEDALIELSFHFTHTCIGSTISRANASNSCSNALETEQDEQLTQILAPTIYLWRAIMGRQNHAVNLHLAGNYERSINWIKDFNIPLPDNFQKRDIICQL